jgi:hypothetical protein
MTRAYWWVSCAEFTVRVVTDEQDVITEAAPIVRRFVGQPFENLKRWAASLGGLRVDPLEGCLPPKVEIMKLTSKGENENG